MSSHILLLVACRLGGYYKLLNLLLLTSVTNGGITVTAYLCSEINMSKKIYDLYGFKDEHIEKTKNKIEKAINADFNEHESSFYGIYYLLKIENIQYKIYENFDGNDFHQDDHKDYTILLNIDYSDRHPIPLSKLKDDDLGYMLLRRTVIDEKLIKIYSVKDNNLTLKAERKKKNWS